MNTHFRRNFNDTNSRARTERKKERSLIINSNLNTAKNEFNGNQSMFKISLFVHPPSFRSILLSYFRSVCTIHTAHSAILPYRMREKSEPGSGVEPIVFDQKWASFIVENLVECNIAHINRKNFWILFAQNRKTNKHGEEKMEKSTFTHTHATYFLNCACIGFSSVRLFSFRSLQSVSQWSVVHNTFVCLAGSFSLSLLLLFILLRQFYFTKTVGFYIYIYIYVYMQSISVCYRSDVI